MRSAEWRGRNELLTGGGKGKGQRARGRAEGGERNGRGGGEGKEGIATERKRGKIRDEGTR